MNDRGLNERELDEVEAAYRSMVADLNSGEYSSRKVVVDLVHDYVRASETFQMAMGWPTPFLVYGDIPRMACVVIPADGIDPKGSSVKSALPPRVPILVVPTNWLQQIQENRVYELGGIVAVASVYRDVQNERATDEGESACRAMAYESLFLQDVRALHRRYKVNRWQASALAQFPLGLDSLPPDLRYTPKTNGAR